MVKSLFFFSRSKIFNDFKYMMIFGPPGVGKGSYAFRLKDNLNLNHISTGDEIRSMIKNPEKSDYSKELIEKIQSIVQQGKLIDDQIVIEILSQKIIQSKESNQYSGVLLDGCPRTIRQLYLYDEKEFPIDIVINVELEREYLIKRLMSRRVCSVCGQTYNLMTQPSKKGNQCEKDDGELVQRKDDQLEVINQRMIEYEKLTQPLYDSFVQRQIVLNYDAIDGFKTYDKLVEDIKTFVN